MRYGGLLTLTLMSFLLVTSEFLPNGVLTEIAASLDITPGQAGLTVGVTAFAGLLIAPTIGLVFPRMDRRTLLTLMALLGAASNLMVAVMPSFALILVARFLLGVALSTFWTMSITAATRMAGPGRLGQALMFTSAGVSLATVAGVPLGVVLSGLVDWRVTFAIIGGAMLLLAVGVRTLLPPVPAAATSSLAALGRTLLRPGVWVGMLGHVGVVFGHFIAYTFVRLALERVAYADGTPISPNTIVLLLAAFGIGGLIGNLVIGLIIDRALTALSIAAPLVIALAVIAVLAAPGALWAVALAVLVWGFWFASWLLIVNTWVGHRLPDALEAGGSLVTVGFQAGIMLAAGLGGVLVDAFGVSSAYLLGGAALVAGSVLFAIANRVGPQPAVSS